MFSHQMRSLVETLSHDSKLNIKLFDRSIFFTNKKEKKVASQKIAMFYEGEQIVRAFCYGTIIFVM